MPYPGPIDDGEAALPWVMETRWGYVDEQDLSEGKRGRGFQGCVAGMMRGMQFVNSLSCRMRGCAIDSYIS